MDRVNKICSHALWQQAVAKIQELEKERVFCGHDVAHFLDVARLAYIENLEKGLALDKELIYGAALLHDIGRGLEYAKTYPMTREASFWQKRFCRTAAIRKKKKTQFWRQFPATEQQIPEPERIWRDSYTAQTRNPGPVSFVRHRQNVNGAQKRKILP